LAGTDYKQREKAQVTGKKIQQNKWVIKPQKVENKTINHGKAEKVWPSANAQ